MAITRADITGTAEALLAEGVNPTMAMIRERLGGGSFATISPILREWKEKHQAEALKTQEAPPQALELGQRVAGMIWQEAMKQAGQRIEETERRTAELVQEAHTERDEALGEVARLERELAEAREQLQAKDKALVEAGQTVATLQTRLEDNGQVINELRERLKTAETEAREARDQSAELRGRLSVLEGKAPTTAPKKKSTSGKTTQE